MPLKVRLKVTFIVFALCGLDLLLWVLAWPLGLLFMLAALLGAEMIYPKWNFFGKALLNVKKAGPRAIALTFDDGPSEWTSKILDTLNTEKIKATFFLLGSNLLRHPEIARRIKNEGHGVGLHAFSHTKMHLKNPEFIKKELDQTEAAFKSLGIEHDNLFRFPHGFKNFFGVRELKRRGWILCGWGRGVWDSKRPGVSVIVERSLQLKAGEILLLHDGDGAKLNPDRAQTAEALSQIIRGLKDKGYQFVSLKDV